MAKIAVIADVKDKVLSDILEIAAEGGINYWAHCYLNYEKNSALVEELKLRDHEDEEAPTFVISRQDLLNGIGNALSRQFFSNSTDLLLELLQWDDCGGCLVDAEVADVFVQYACFDGVIYG